MTVPPIRLLSVIGTRPEAIKMAPLAIAATARPGLAHRLVATRQHDQMVRDALSEFGLVADEELPPPKRDAAIGAAVAAMRGAVAELLTRERPDMLLVQGDTNSALAAAQAAHDAGVPVGHVEAGLRSHDLARPWPEEANRVAIDALATLLFAPTSLSHANLKAEPAVNGHVLVTGNTGIDALMRMRLPIGLRAPMARRLVLVTCHRRESIGAGIYGICAALRSLAARGDVRILLPLHPNPDVREPIEAALAGVAHIDLVEPLGYREMIRRMDEADLILTDSGGIQEEAPALGVPVLVLRDVTERPEAQATGNLKLVGTDPDSIVAAAKRLLDEADAHAAMARPAFPYGPGDAAPRILDAIEAWAALR